MLKGRSLKSCAALVVFCFSLLLACISPAWATTQGQPVSDVSHPITIYAAPQLSDPITTGQSFSLPIFDAQPIKAVKPGDYSSLSLAFQSLQFQPFGYDVSLVIGFTVQGQAGSVLNSNVSISSYNGLCITSDYFARGWLASSPGVSTVNPTFPNGGTYNDNTYKDKLPYFVTSYVLPAGTNGFRWGGTPWTSVTIQGSDALFACYVAYIVNSGDASVVDQVNAILVEVKKVNGNLTSTLSVLNQILAQCRDIKADTASIVSILGLCKDQLVTLNGKVDDIYKLLKDSLSAEAGAVDKKAEELGGQIMQRVDSEQYWSDKNTENFEALDMGNWTFGDGVVGALPTVGNLFKSLWDSIGEATLIFIFPLMLGIALVIVGRVSRTAGKGAKKGGGDDG